MKILKLCVAVVSLTIAIFFCIHKNIVKDNSSEMYSVPINETLRIEEATQSPVDNREEVLVSKTLTTANPVKETELLPTETPSPTPGKLPDITASQPKGAFAEITIKTDKKNGSYTVMPDVYENTLRYNIGWLPSSSLPGEDGICVFMGHRDTDFRILQYLKTGDEIIVEKQNSTLIYTVYKLEIVNSDSELRFDVPSSSSLVLVTCYPFRYSGHAPQKFVVFSNIKSVQK